MTDIAEIEAALELQDHPEVTPGEMGDFQEKAHDRLRFLIAQVRELEAENEKYSAGMQENCRLRKEAAALQARIDAAAHAGDCARVQDVLGGYDHPRKCSCWKSEGNDE